MFILIPARLCIVRVLTERNEANERRNIMPPPQQHFHLFLDNLCIYSFAVLHSSPIPINLHVYFILILAARVSSCRCTAKMDEDSNKAPFNAMSLFCFFVSFFFFPLLLLLGNKCPKPPTLLFVALQGSVSAPSLQSKRPRSRRTPLTST